MPREPGIEFDGAVYHVMSRGHRQEGIYRDDTDRVLFPETLTKVCARTGWIVHAYVLMDNHYHQILQRALSFLINAASLFPLVSPVDTFFSQLLLPFPPPLKLFKYRLFQ